LERSTAIGPWSPSTGQGVLDGVMIVRVEMTLVGINNPVTLAFQQQMQS
jgi:hypothetical protein